MTEARYSVKEDTYYLCCDGHATGSREVCNAVSAICYTLAGYVGNADQHTTVDNAELDEGYAELAFSTDDPKVIGAFEAAVCGLKQISDSYSDYLRVHKIR